MHHSYTLELDCRQGQVPRPGDAFTLRVLREEKFEVLHVAAYPKPLRRPDGTTITHHIRYRRKLP